MTHLNNSERTQYVSQMFGRIAHRYDLLNRIMTFGMDIRLRKLSIQLLDPQSDMLILDAGSGTGDLAAEILRRKPDAKVIASDLTPEMVLVGKKRFQDLPIMWVIADAQNLPFKDQGFDGLVSGYLLRNMPNIDTALNEQNRVLTSQSNCVSLDTTPPRANILKPFINLYMHKIIPFIGSILTGDKDAYTYLPDSTAGFLKAEELTERFKIAGFSKVSFKRKLFGTMAIHKAEKLNGQPNSQQ
ncbi:MAG: ubiquinone/menaquinone biosynthesis methyltransferase [Anaerolineaceae bacterium]|nr:ubiquinone/menaquinone biosynthesis methyltransferase [Anaerolineaceae bacterium]